MSRKSKRHLRLAGDAESARCPPVVRCYLDVDGVLAPYGAPGCVPSSWPDFVDGYLGPKLAVYSPAMLSALSELELEVVWCTTWGPHAERAFGPLLGSGPRRTLDLNSTPLAAGGVKGAAVFADLREDPAPFVWIDDDAITTVAVERLESVDLPMLLLEPTRTVGLTPGHLEQIAAFVRALRGSGGR